MAVCPNAHASCNARWSFCRGRVRRRPQLREASRNGCRESLHHRVERHSPHRSCCIYRCPEFDERGNAVCVSVECRSVNGPAAALLRGKMRLRSGRPDVPQTQAQAAGSWREAIMKGRRMGAGSHICHCLCVCAALQEQPSACLLAFFCAADEWTIPVLLVGRGATASS